jgi:hypothetical protein
MGIFTAPQTSILAVHALGKMEPCLICEERYIKDYLTFLNKEVLKSGAVVDTGLVISLFQLMHYGHFVWMQLQLRPQNPVSCIL